MLPAMLLLGVLLVAVAARVADRLVYRPVPYPAGAGPTAWAPAPAPRPPARPDRAPSSPADWAARDAEVARVVVLAGGRAGTVRGEGRCACGGALRYTLGRLAGLPLRRCLHCGTLHAGAEPVPQA